MSQHIKGKEITAEIRALIVTMVKKAKTCQEIASTIHKNYKTCHNIIGLFSCLSPLCKRLSPFLNKYFININLCSRLSLRFKRLSNIK